MNFTQSVASGFRNYANGGGRAARSEYWYWALFELMVTLATAGADVILFPDIQWPPFGGPVETVTDVLLFLPGFAISIRRLHDIDRSGYWVLIMFTIVGILLLIYWACIRGTKGDNDFGPDPLAVPTGKA